MKLIWPELTIEGTTRVAVEGVDRPFRELVLFNWSDDTEREVTVTFDEETFGMKPEEDREYLLAEFYSGVWQIAKAGDP